MILARWAGLATRIARGFNVDFLPDWAGRQLLAESLRDCGLQWAPYAIWRRPSEAWMTYDDRLQAVELEARVVAAARRCLPPGVSGAALGDAWREQAWRCIVAGLALLDTEAREQLAAGDDDDRGMVGKPVEKVPQVSHAPAGAVLIRRRTPGRPIVLPPATLTIRRRGEVPRAS